MIIRKARKQDAKKISALRRNTIKKILSKYYSEKVIGYLAEKNAPKHLLEKIERIQMFCAWEDGKLVGTISLEDNKIGGAFVKASMIGKGIGTRMMNFIEILAKRNGIKTARLYPSRFAVNFYKHRGYKITKKSVWKTKEFSCVSYEMKKRLK